MRLISCFKPGEFCGGLVHARDRVDGIQRAAQSPRNRQTRDYPRVAHHLLATRRRVLLRTSAVGNCCLSSVAHLHGVDPHPSNFNRRDTRETLDDHAAVAVFEVFESRPRLERLTANFAPELRTRSLGQCARHTDNTKSREEVVLIYMGILQRESKFCCTLTYKSAVSSKK